MKRQLTYLLIITLALLGSLINPYKVGESDSQLIELPLPKNPQQVLLDSMTVEQKVGQLFMFGFYGPQLTEETKELITNKHIGGILLLKYNIENNTQLTNLITQIQSLSDIPLLISIDQEGGIVSRLTDNEILTKPQSEIKDNLDAYNTAYERGKILKGLGINTNLAPVVEYITDKNSFLYPRVFTGEIQQVSEKSLSMIQGYTDARIISVPKHYPGHSNYSIDSHLTLPEVNITDYQWDEYIYPFEYILGSPDTKAIMVGHILYPNIDSEPSTLSYEILTVRLREKLKYKGVVITDDMEMGALKNEGEYTQLAKKALLAGNDVLLFTGKPDVQQEVYNYILQEIQQGNIDIKIVDEKVLRILELKLNTIY
jgi:beta-N-acetylhexosaminidase